jgi:DNA polymerase-1
MTPAGLAAARTAEALASPCERSNDEIIRSLDRLEAWIAAAYDGGVLALDLHASGTDPMQAEIIGLSLALAPGRAAYVPFAHTTGGDLLGGGRAPDQIQLDAALAALKGVLEDVAVLKIGHDLKFEAQLLLGHGIRLRAFDDIMLISYALDSGRGSHGLAELASRHLGHACIGFDSVTGTGRQRVPFAEVAIDRAAPYGAEAADIALRLWRALKPRLVAEGMMRVYERLERPLVPVLALMERRGIAIDRQMLSRLSGDFAQSMGRLEDEIFTLAGEEFNLGSPKQLGDILFGKMGLPGGSKTKTGAWSTGAQVLDELAEAGHALPRKILDWRQVSKLKSTYTDALPGYIHPETRRVHTSFALASTSTGRLSSQEPNIQNIPVRTEEGRKIRRAFVATEGHKLVSADYSQIELRLLAHIADIPQLVQAFADGVDIHALTASEMFGVPVEGMPAEVRRRAKAINFGIIYGISAFGLANQLGIGRDEARAYIAKYFERFPGIRDYMEAMKAEARRNGYVRTIFGRKCHFAWINSKNMAERSFHERAAINAPIQGSAADIIRRAMIRMDDALKAARLSAKMLLQVHDELIFEVPDEEVAATLPVVSRVMEDAPHPAVQLRVPLHVDARAAHNWDEAH